MDLRLSTLAAISFAAPAMLLGLGLLSLPVLAHLLNRRARRRVVFPTIALLSESAASQSRLFKLRRLLLLLLRCLAVLFIVLGFAHPNWREQASGAPARGHGAAVVLVLDRSASTAQQVDGIRAVHSLRAAARRALDSLQSGDDVANIIYADGEARAVFPSLTGNVEVLQQAIEDAESNPERADLVGAIALAGKVLAEHSGPRHLVILSDLQATNWIDVPQRLGADQPLPSDTIVRIVPPPSAAPKNVALFGPAIYPHRPVAGQMAQLTAKLVNYSDRRQTVTIEMSDTDGTVRKSQSASLSPFQEHEISFAQRFQNPGAHAIKFTIPGDALEIDNDAYLAIQVVRRMPLVIVGDEGANDVGTSVYFTRRALAPRDGGADRYEVRHLSSSNVSRPELAGAATMFVVYTRPLPAAALEAIHQYMVGGGGVVWFCGDGPVTRNLLALDQLVEGETLLPWQPGARRNPAARGELLSFADGDWRSALLRVFDHRNQGALAQIRFGRVWSVGKVSPDARVLLRYSDGSVALASRAVGAGRLVVANFTPAWGSSDLGKHGAFVALMQSLVEDLRPKHPTEQAATVGSPITVTADRFDPKGRAVVVLGPDQASIDDFESSAYGDRLVVTIAHPDAPGFYQVVQGDDPLGTASINVDPRESDLRRLDPAPLKGLLMSQGINANVHAPADGQAVLETKGKPLWGLMLAAALVAIALELTLLAIWRR